MTSKQRAYLRSLAANTPVRVHIGKGGLVPGVTEAVLEAFNTNELVKIGVLQNCMEDIDQMAQALSERSRSVLVQVIGKKIVLYKADKDKPRIVLPKA